MPTHKEVVMMFKKVQLYNEDEVTTIHIFSSSVPILLIIGVIH